MFSVLSIDPVSSDRALVLSEGFLGELKLVLKLVEGFQGELKLVLERVKGFLEEQSTRNRLLDQRLCLHRTQDQVAELSFTSHPGQLEYVFYCTYNLYRVAAINPEF